MKVDLFEMIITMVEFDEGETNIEINKWKSILMLQTIRTIIKRYLI